MPSNSFTINYDDFAQFVIEKWQTKIVTLGITDTRVLFNSFTSTLHREANGDTNKITFTFHYYGKFLEMGVFGSGRRKTNTNKKHYRAKQPWYSAAFARQVRRLADLLAKQYGYESVATIAEGLKAEG